MIYDLRFTILTERRLPAGLTRPICKKLRPFIRTIALLLLVLLLPAPARCITPFVGQFYTANGSPMTNPVTMQAWPQTFTWTVNGTNIIYGGLIITNTPNASGWFSNSFYANGFRLYVPAYNSYLFGYLPDTTNVVNLATCLSNAPATAQGLSQYGLITNWLGFAPQPLLGYTPATNTYSALTNILGFIPATNGGSLVYSQLPYTPPTNNYAGLTNVLGFTPATNNPQTFTWTNVVAVAGIINNSGYVTNVATTIQTNSVNYQHP